MSTLLTASQNNSVRNCQCCSRSRKTSGVSCCHFLNVRILSNSATFFAVALSILLLAAGAIADKYAPLEDLDTKSNKWQVRIPGGAQREMAISDPTKANWSKYGVLSLSARLLRAENPPQNLDPSLRTIRLLVYLQNKDRWWYQSASTFLISRRWTTIELDLSSDSADWTPAGHFRPWDGYVTSYITKVGVKAFSNIPYIGEIELRDVELREADRKSRESERELTVLDFATNRDKVYAGELFEISFRLSRSYKNPFDKDEIDVSAIFQSPTGRVDTIAGFFDQEYIEKREMTRFGKRDELGFINRRLIPVGASLWKVRYVPDEIGQYRYGIIIRDSSAASKSLFRKSGTRIVRISALRFECVAKRAAKSGDETPRMENPMKQSEPSTSSHAPVPSREKSQDISVLFPDTAPSIRPTERKSLPPFVKKESVEGTTARAYTPDGWKIADIPAELLIEDLPSEEDEGGKEILLWRVPLHWTPKWGKYRGLGQFNMEVAWRFEKMLARAEAAGISLPIRLNGDEEYLNRETYRWPDNPLNALNGGPIRTPSRYFTNPLVTKWFKSEVRYIMARWGHSKAIGDIFLCKRFLADNADAWHEQIGKHLSGISALRWKESEDFDEETKEGTGRAPLSHREQIHRTIFSLHPQAESFPMKRLVSGIKRGYTDWRVEERISPDVRASVERELSSEGSRSLKLGVSFPGEAAIYKQLDRSNDNWFDYDKLAFDVYIPPQAPGDMRAMIYLRDGDLWWYEQLLRPYLRPGDWTKLWVDLRGSERRSRRKKGKGRQEEEDPKEDEWVAQGHSSPWNNYTRQRIREIGLRFFGHEEYRGHLYVDNVEVWGKRKPRASEIPPTSIYAFEINDDKIELYKKFEVTFKLSRTYSNPYDPDVIDIKGEFIAPSGKLVKIPAFFYQGYERRLEIGRNRLEEVKREKIIPQGEPCWKIRFAPTEVGSYSYTIRVRDARVAKTDPMSFECLPSDDPGFVRVSKIDRKYLERDNGDFFYPIGHNLRSPVDVRPQAYRDLLIPDKSRGTYWRGRSRGRFQVFSSNRRYLESIEGQGTYLFDKFFKRMAENGENWTRIWMCPWWCGLEWKRDRYGYHGMGRYNQQNAWRLDYLIEQAEQKDIFVQLLTTNHGQYTSDPRLDAEWPNNPYNTNNGGFLGWAGDFYRKEKAKKTYRNRMRYTIARWGYSTKIMMWILMGEVEWTDGYKHSRNDVDNWLREMAMYVKTTDPWRHIVSTHFSNVHHGLEVWSFPEMEACLNNAYTPLGELQSRNVVQAVNNYYNMWMKHFGKPVLISEWGGFWMSNRSETLLIELHSGIWASYMTPLAGSTGFWWWNFLDVRNLYPHYKGLANFAKGEDLRRKRYVKVRSERGSAASKYRSMISGRGTSGRSLAYEGMVNGSSGYLWVYDPIILERVPDRWDVVIDFGGMRSSLTIDGWRDGAYRIEYWHTYTGEKVYETTVEASRNRLEIKLPRVRTDIAIKIKPA